MAVNNMNDDLEDFRKRWQQEIVSNQSNNNSDILHDGPSSEALEFEISSKLHIEEQAASMFLKGVNHEKLGEMTTAIKCYKTALRLDPDIEKRIYEEKLNEAKSAKDISGKEGLLMLKDIQQTNSTSEHFSEEVDTNLLEKFQRAIEQSGRLCSPKDEDYTGTHISALPREVIIYVLKWVVSSELDLRSLEQVSLVCKGFYVCSRLGEIWKLACLKIWNGNCGMPSTLGLYRDWRHMFIIRPRLQFNGCYISKMTYVRPGENSFQDTSYQPWHLINYFRFLRFFADRSALMLTSSELPSTIIGQLKPSSGRHPGILFGKYTLQGNIVAVTFTQRRATPLPTVKHVTRRGRRAEQQAVENPIVEQIFYLELEIRSSNKKHHCALHWICYSVETKYHQAESTKAHFDLNPVRFPPLFFSRVRSYCAKSENPLDLSV